MGLQEHLEENKNDHFEYNEERGRGFGFPCCVCEYLFVELHEMPCRECVYNPRTLESKKHEVNDE